MLLMQHLQATMIKQNAGKCESSGSQIPNIGLSRNYDVYFCTAFLTYIWKAIQIISKIYIKQKVHFEMNSFVKPSPYAPCATMPIASLENFRILKTWFQFN